MRIAWSYAGQHVAGYEELLERYNAKGFASPKRSTVPFLAYWRNPDQRARELSEALGFALSDSICLDFEHEVPVQRGTGRPSCTDLRLTSGGVSVAIEAKSTEPRYEDVATWLGEPARANRIEVLAGWLDLLRTCATTNLEIDDVAGLPYQIVHRAASACYLDAEIRWLVYQVFDVSLKKREMYLTDLRTLSTLLRAGFHLRICLVECSVQRTKRQTELEQMWESGERDLREFVLAGLRAGDLLQGQLEQVVVV